VNVANIDFAPKDSRGTILRATGAGQSVMLRIPEA